MKVPGAYSVSYSPENGRSVPLLTMMRSSSADN